MPSSLYCGLSVCTSVQRFCPKCKHKAKAADIRLLYVDRISVVDRTGVDELMERNKILELVCPSLSLFFVSLCSSLCVSVLFCVSVLVRIDIS